MGGRAWALNRAGTSMAVELCTGGLPLGLDSMWPVLVIPPDAPLGRPPETAAVPRPRCFRGSRQRLGISATASLPRASRHMASYLNPEYEESYSLWLMPKGGTAQLLQKEIDTLARGHPGAPVFEPHVTLLPDVRLPGEQVVAKARELAALVKVRANPNLPLTPSLGSIS